MHSIFQSFFVLARLLNGPDGEEWRRGGQLHASRCHLGEQFRSPVSAMERYGLEMPSIEQHLFRLRP